MLFYGWSQFVENPLWLVRIDQGGMSFHGGLLGVLTALYLYARRTKRSFAQVTDFVAPLVPFGLGTGRLGNFIGGELWGRASDVPWAMVFPADPLQLPRHPSQLYQFVAEGVILFIAVWLFSRRPRPEAAVSGFFLLAYGLLRTAAELFRQPDPQLGYLIGGLTMGQLLSLPMVLIGTIVLVRSARPPHTVLIELKRDRLRSPPMKQYLALLQHVMDEGVFRDDRTGTGTWSVFGYQMRFDLSQHFPLVTTKRCHLHSIIHELLWFLRGDTNVNSLREQGVSIWNDWATDEGELGPIYGTQWRRWEGPDGTLVDQIKELVHNIKTQPDSRRLVVSSWNPSVLPDPALSPQDNAASGRQALPPATACSSFMWPRGGCRASCTSAAPIFFWVCPSISPAMHC